MIDATLLNDIFDAFSHYGMVIGYKYCCHRLISIVWLGCGNALLCLHPSWMRWSIDLPGHGFVP